MYATDRVLLKVSGINYGAQLVSVTWSINNNARIEETMTDNRLAEVVTLGNIRGNASITEKIIQGVPTIDWFNFNWDNAILEVHPASNTYQAPVNMVKYDGQVRILNVLAVDDNAEDFAGAGIGATRTLRLLLSNASYQ